MTMSLSVVVCTCNHARTLAQTLTCLALQDADPQCFEVIVVDNHCTDDTPAVIAAARTQLPRLRTVLEPMLGQAYARVRGVRESRAEWIAFVDDDNYLDPSWIRAALHFAGEHPACGAFGGRVSVEWETPPPPTVARRAYAYAATDLPGGAHHLKGEDRWRLRGAGLVCRRAALVGTGWLDWQANAGRIGQGLSGGDDTEIVMRLARDGWAIWYEPACHLRHAIASHRLTTGYLRALHQGFARADPLLLGLRGRGSLVRWAGCFALLLVRRVVALGRHLLRAPVDTDARLTARLTLDGLLGHLRGLSDVTRLSASQRRAWLGQTIHRPIPSPQNGAVGSSVPRFLHLHSGMDYGGLERLLLCLGADRAEAPGMEPVFGLCYHERLARELGQVGAHLEILGGFSRFRPWGAPLALLRLARLLHRERFAAVVCHGSASLASFGWVARLASMPVVFWMHSDTKIQNKNLVERLAGQISPALAICNSKYTAASLPLLFAVPPPHVVIYCPVSPPQLHPGHEQQRRKLRAEQSTPLDAVVIILPSRLQLWKGHGLLLEALCRLKDEPGWVCWIVGGPFDREQAQTLETLQAAAHAGGIAGSVRFLGQRDDVPELLAAADVFCQPNLTPEPFGVNAIEALYAGLPVVASDSGGTREIVDAACGRLIKPGNAAALAAELSSLIRDPALRRAMGAQAPGRGRAISDPARILPEVEECFAALGTVHRSGSSPLKFVQTSDYVSHG